MSSLPLFDMPEPVLDSDTEARLQRLDRLAKRGSRNAELGACPGEAALAGHDRERGQFIEALSHL